jgi:hypothetical protein
LSLESGADVNKLRAATAGVAGTVAMTVLFLLEPLAGLPKVAEGGILSTVMSVSVAHFPVGVAGGWAIHFLVGILLALLYAGYFARRLPGGLAMRGALYGGLVFIAAQLAIMPLVGAGVFSGGDLERLAGSLAGHLVYGAVVGLVCGQEAVEAGRSQAPGAA